MSLGPRPLDRQTFSDRQEEGCFNTRQELACPGRIDQSFWGCWWSRWSCVAGNIEDVQQISLRRSRGRM